VSANVKPFHKRASDLNDRPQRAIFTCLSYWYFVTVRPLFLPVWVTFQKAKWRVNTMPSKLMGSETTASEQITRQGLGYPISQAGSVETFSPLMLLLTH
jgi:hypothetical protein